MRIVHYKGFVNGKRVYEKHPIDSPLIPDIIGIKTLNLASNSQIDSASVAQLGRATVS